jgi:phosphoribosylamine---glycine ligase
MRIFIVGGGGREHALAWRLARAGHEIVVAPGNPGIAREGEVVPIAATDVEALANEAARRAVELVVVGPEAPLVAGLADALRARGVPVFGPSASAARLEGSKRFSKELFRRHGIRTAEFAVCQAVSDAERAIAELGGEVVVKADGLAAGKGVVVCERAEQALEAAREMLESGRFGDAGSTVVIERRLRGRELSVMALTDGARYEILAQAEDHKAVHDGDRGPNTGGMGTVSPAAWATDALLDRVRREIFDPTMKAFADEGIDYRGVLYAGLMIDDAGAPWILEYNCRFGDPETQAVVVRLDGDLAPWLLGAAQGALPEGSLAWDARASVCVVLAAANYPASPELGDSITGIEAAEALGDVTVFHAGTQEQDDQLVTSGGRVLGVTALGADVEAARELGYRAAGAISFRGMHYRGDIGARPTGERGG